MSGCGTPTKKTFTAPPYTGGGSTGGGGGVTQLPTVQLCPMDWFEPTPNDDGTYTFPPNFVSWVDNQLVPMLIHTQCNLPTGPALDNCVDNAQLSYMNANYPGFLTLYPGAFQGNSGGAQTFATGMAGKTQAAGYPLSYSQNGVDIFFLPGHGYYSCGHKMPNAVAQALLGSAYRQP